MRVLNKISVAFLVIDAVSKEPIKKAVIRFDGERKHFTYKNPGWFVFLDLQEKAYSCSIEAEGYDSREMKVVLLGGDNPVVKAKAEGYDEGEITIDENTLICEMVRKVDLSKLNVVPYAYVTKGKEPLVNEIITIRQDTKIPYLRVIKNTTDGANEIALNSDFNALYLYQSFFSGLDSASSLTIDGYNVDTRLFTLKAPLGKKIKTGTLLKPYWKVRTDAEGRIAIPFNVKFFYQDVIDYTLMIGDTSKKLKLNLSDKEIKTVKF